MFQLLCQLLGIHLVILETNILETLNKTWPLLQILVIDEYQLRACVRGCHQRKQLRTYAKKGFKSLFMVIWKVARALESPNGIITNS